MNKQDRKKLLELLDNQVKNADRQVELFDEARAKLHKRRGLAKKKSNLYKQMRVAVKRNNDIRVKELHNRINQILQEEEHIGL